MKTSFKTKGNNFLIWGISLFVMSLCFKAIDYEFFIFLQGLFLGLSLVFYGAAIFTMGRQK